MDRFADGMIARGPTLARDRETWTGSLHILDLPDEAAARAFVEHEPYNRAGLFAEHLIRPFRNLLGRTMWEAPDESDDPLYLVIADAVADLAPERLIVHGALLPSGAVYALRAPARPAGGEVHDWEFGGRR